MKSILSLMMFAAFVSAPASAQLTVYPTKEQSIEQQQKDEAECYAWAKGQSGYDPVQAAPTAQQSVGGERVGGANRGALGGAAIGAVGGTLLGGARQRHKQASNEQANSTAAGYSTAATALSTCLCYLL